MPHKTLLGGAATAVLGLALLGGTSTAVASTPVTAPESVTVQYDKDRDHGKDRDRDHGKDKCRNVRIWRDDGKWHAVWRDRDGDRHYTNARSLDRLFDKLDDKCDFDKKERDRYKKW